MGMKNPLEKNPKTTDEKFDYIISLIEGLATKAELAESVSNLATKDELTGLVKNTDEKFDSLAIMVAKGFERTATKEDIAELKERVAVVEEVTKNTRQDVLNIGEKFVSRAEFDNHVVKFGNLEKKVSEFA